MSNTGGSLSQGEREQLAYDLAAGSKTRDEVLRAVAENTTLRAREFNRAFVYMQYAGYLRCDSARRATAAAPDC